MRAGVQGAASAEGTRGRGAEKKLAAVGWGLFLLWVGVAMLLGFGTAAGLLGVGVITLGVQAMRRYAGLALEGFWVVIGVLFTLGGLGALYEVDVPIVPIVLVSGGVLLLVSVLRRDR